MRKIITVLVVLTGVLLYWIYKAGDRTMAIWIKKSPDAEPVWMAADNRIRELALSIERRAGIAPDADGLRQIREWATEIVCQCDMVERVWEQAEPTWKR